MFITYCHYHISTIMGMFMIIIIIIIIIVTMTCMLHHSACNATIGRASRVTDYGLHQITSYCTHATYTSL